MRDISIKAWKTFRKSIPLVDLMIRWIPISVRHGGGALIFRITGNAKLGLRVAEGLAARGAHDMAKRAYLRCNAHLEKNRYTRRRAILQFRVQRGLYRYGLHTVSDPLFECVPSSAGDAGPIHAGGSFCWATRYNGISVHGWVAAGGSDLPESLEIRVDDLLLSKLRLDFRSGIAPFKLNIRRPVIDCFPRKARITIETSTGQRLMIDGSDHLDVGIPHGNGRLSQEIGKRGLLNKKGRFKEVPEELAARHSGYIELYDRVRGVFDENIGRPLLLMFGTLLGHHRDGNIIPWDDDFDVGYLSSQSIPKEVKNEAKDVIWKLLRAGYEVVIKRNRSSSIKVRDRDGDLAVFLSVCPIWEQRGEVWAEIQARLPMTAASFVPVEDTLGGIKVYKPRDTESFLAAYYGPHWRHPDPRYSNSSVRTPIAVLWNLARARFTEKDVRELQEAVALERRTHPEFGDLFWMETQSLYPLNEYARRCAW